MAVQRSGTVRAVAERSRAFSLAKACSIGFLLNRVEVRTVGREIEQLCACRLDGLAHPGHLRSGEVVEDDRVAALQHRNQGVSDIGPEAGAVRGPVQEGGRSQAGGPPRRGDGGGLGVTVRYGDAAALAARSPARATGPVR